MTTAVQHRRGTTAEHATFTGLEGEVTIDTTKDTAVIHDGTLAGGYPLAKENLANVTTSGLSSIDGASTASDDKFFIYDQSATALKTITRAELNNAMEQDALANVAITGGTINGTAIGGTTAAAGAFTTLTTSSTVTHNGGTANGVAYLNGSKVLTTGSALTFDGNFELGIANAASSANNKLVLTGFNSFGNAYVLTGASSATNSLSIGTQTNIPTIFAINGSEQMRLTSTGLGIGTSSPSRKLTVSGSGVFTDGTNDITLWNDGSVGTNGSVNLKFNTGGALRATLDTSGNLGLGVTPSALLWPNGSAGGLQLQAGALLSAYNATTYLSNNWYYNAGEKYIGNGYATRYEQTTGKHAWYYAGNNTSGAGATVSWTQAMTLDASGNLGIGITSPAARLDLGAGSGGTGLKITDQWATIITSSQVVGTRYQYGAGTTYGQSYADAYGFNLNTSTAAVPIIFGTNNTERARIDSSGNLLIGTTSVTTGISGTETTLCLKGNSTSKAASFVAVNASGTGTSVFGTGDSTVACYVGTATNHPLVFQTNNTERARIDSSGNLLIGRTSSVGKVDIESAKTTQLYINQLTGGSNLILFDFNGTTIGSITTNGVTTAYNTSSDYRLKNTIAPMTGALAKVAQLKPCTYKWNADGSDGEGFIAHELAEVVPQCVTGEKDAVDAEGNPKYQGIDTSFLIATLTAAIQEQQAIIEQLKARLDAANL